MFHLAFHPEIVDSSGIKRSSSPLQKGSDEFMLRNLSQRQEINKRFYHPNCVQIKQVKKQHFNAIIDFTCSMLQYTWVKVFRINPEFRILRLSQPQNAELGRL